MVSRFIKAILACLAASDLAIAETGSAPNWNAETLSGDWSGARSTLCQRGVAVDLTHKMPANTSGGVSRAGGLADEQCKSQLIWI